MSFQELYDYSQTVVERIHRDDLKARAEQLSGVGRIAAMQSGLDPLICRGMYLSLKNTEHRFIQQHGCNVIVLARDLDKFWQRYIFVKELMHVFSDPSEATDSGEKLEKLLIELSGGIQEEVSPAMKSEIDCAWMALAILCPEEKRLNYRHSHLRGEIDNYRISQELRIPEQQVYHLLHVNFDKSIARILAGG